MAAPQYMLDTNICIYAMQSKLPVLRRFGKHRPQDLAISSLVAAELAFGVEKSSRPAQNKKFLDLFLGSMNIVAWDESAMWHYAKHRKSLAQAGTPIGLMDLLLASQALALNAVFVTNNTREFTRIEGLKLENWV